MKILKYAYYHVNRIKNLLTIYVPSRKSRTFSTRGPHIYPKTNLFYRALRGKIRLFEGKYETREKKKTSFHSVHT